MIQTEDPFKDTSWAYEVNSIKLPFFSSCAHPYPSSMALNVKTKQECLVGDCMVAMWGMAPRPMVPTMTICGP